MMVPVYRRETKSIYFRCSSPDGRLEAEESDYFCVGQNCSREGIRFGMGQSQTRNSCLGPTSLLNFWMGEMADFAAIIADTYISPIRNVVALDDEFPTLDLLVGRKLGPKATEALANPRAN